MLFTLAQEEWPPLLPAASAGVASMSVASATGSVSACCAGGHHPPCVGLSLLGSAALPFTGWERGQLARWGQLAKTFPASPKRSTVHTATHLGENGGTEPQPVV